MITQQHTQEAISLAFVHAVSGAAGVNCEVGRVFDYGLDGSFRPVIIRNNRRVESGFPLDFQLKCSWNWSVTGDAINYQLRSKNYNDLVSREPQGVGALLIVMCIPKEQSLWVDITEDRLQLQKCSYFTILHGDPVANEDSTKMVTLPRANVLTPSNLLQALHDERMRRSGVGA